jgi:hypothetical protein
MSAPRWTYYVPLIELAEIVGNDLEALCWLRRLLPQTREEAQALYREHWPEVLGEFDRLRERFTAGDGAALLEAVDSAGELGVPLPEWVAEGFGQAWGSYTEAEARTLGEAFGVERGKSWSREAARKMGYTPLIRERIRALSKAGLVTAPNAGAGRTIFEQIAKELANPVLLADKDNPAPDSAMASVFKPIGWLKPLHVPASWVEGQTYPRGGKPLNPED